ncbi:hypothetical protein [Adhaeribacter aquaticus]|uniref:hypothetical protein n=1 Tax=Adhaeribacter aquaticus TaxID=299567 RepID=UPI00047AD27B|nr:hypothetical protein [Adhaeribacter aquaticus]
MNLFNRKTDNVFPLQVKIVGFALVFCGIISFLQIPLLGVGLLLLSILILFTHYGVVLNLDTLYYKEYWGLFGLKFGNWKSLPKLWRITITNDKIIIRNQSYNTGLSTYSSNTQTALNIRINEFEYIRIAKGKYKDIKADALFLSDQFKLEILDATTDKKEIITPK